MDYGYADQAVPSEDCTGDGEEGLQREGWVGSVGEVRDGLGVEVVAGGA